MLRIGASHARHVIENSATDALEKRERRKENAGAEKSGRILVGYC